MLCDEKSPHTKNPLYCSLRFARLAGEFWRAEWETTGDAYRNASIARAAAAMPGAPAPAILAAARAQYEAGARIFFEGSLRAFAEMYPLCAATMTQKNMI